jgi:hypothetical protein
VTSEEGKAIVGFLSRLDSRMQRLEKARGYSMQEVLQSQGAKGKGNGDDELVYSTILQAYVPKEDVEAAKSLSHRRRHGTPAEKNKTG